MTSDNPIENKVTPNADAKSQEQTTHPQIPVPPAPTPEHKLQPSPHCCEITCKTEKDWWDKTKPYVEAAGVLLLAIYTFYTIKMYCANKQAADAATRAAKAAEDSVTEARNNAHLDERAWLGVDNIPGSAKIGTFFSAIVYFKNTGKTPARNMRFWGQLDKMQSEPNAASGCGEALKISSRGLVAPGSFHSIPAQTIGHWPKLENGWQKSLSNEGKKIYIYGCVVYDDIFMNKLHWLTFCSSWRDDIHAFENCAQGNDTGDGDVSEQ